MLYYFSSTEREVWWKYGIQIMYQWDLPHLSSFCSISPHSSSRVSSRFSGGVAVDPQLRSLSRDFSQMLGYAFFPSTKGRFSIVSRFRSLLDSSGKQRNSLYKPIKKCESSSYQRDPLDLSFESNDDKWERFTRGFCFVVLPFWLWKTTMKHFYKTLKEDIDLIVTLVITASVLHLKS